MHVWKHVYTHASHHTQTFARALDHALYVGGERLARKETACVHPGAEAVGASRERPRPSAAAGAAAPGRTWLQCQLALVENGLDDSI